jgi:tetratricopeptide (TPR) repeat protein
LPFGRRNKTFYALIMESDAAKLDAFDRAYAWFETNKKPVLYGAVAIVVVGLVVLFIVWHKGEKEKEAGEALSSALAPQMGLAAPEANPGAALQKVANEYPNSDAATRALLLSAGTYFIHSNYTDAMTAFQKFAREHRDSPLLGEALLGIAACYDAEGKTNDAISAYQNLVQAHSTDPTVPQAKFALGRLFEAQGKPEQARSLFEDVWRMDRYGSLGSEAGMRLEELNVKYPNLVQPPKPLINPMSTPVTIQPTASNTATIQVSTQAPASNVQPATSTPKK